MRLKYFPWKEKLPHKEERQISIYDESSRCVNLQI